jgi:hypothetical protein
MLTNTFKVTGISSVLMSTILIFGLNVNLVQASTAITGKELKCSGGPTGPVIYKFVEGKNGEDLASFKDEFGPEQGDYELSGTNLSINGADNGESQYDISNPSKITRFYQSCITPGEDGGDVHPICHEKEEICSLI